MTYESEYWHTHCQELARQNLELRAALVPFAELAEWINENQPEYESDANEVQIEDWPYTIGVGDIRRALKALGKNPEREAA